MDCLGVKGEGGWRVIPRSLAYTSEWRMASFAEMRGHWRRTRWRWRRSWIPFGQVELDVPLRHLSKGVQKAVEYRGLDLKRGLENSFSLLPDEPKIQVILKTRWQARILQADPSLGQLVSISLVLGTVFLGYGYSFIWGKSKVSKWYSEQHSGKKGQGCECNFKTNLFVCFRTFLRILHSAWYMQ